MQGAGLIVLPEMVVGCGIEQTQRLQIAESFGTGPIQERFSKIAKRLGVWLVAGSIPLKANEPTKVRSTHLVYNDKGNVAARYDKIHLFDAQVQNGAEPYLESACVEPGDSIA